MISKYLPIPLSRTSIFTGSNTLSEVLIAFKSLFQKNYRDIQSIEKYEKEFAKTSGCKYAFSFSAGRMGLYAILKSLRLSKDDEIILPAFSCVVVPNALLYAGVKPIYVDIDSENFNIDVNLIESKITSKTKAIYAQHTFGKICDIKKIRELAQKYSLYIIEDSAHALGNKFEGSQVGSLGDVAFFSTDHSKVINTGLGGMVCTNNPKIAEQLQIFYGETPFLSNSLARRLSMIFIIEYFIYLPSLYWLGRYFFFILSKLNFFNLFPNELQTIKESVENYPVRMSSPLAQIGSSQLNNLKQNLLRRREVAHSLHDIIQYNEFDPNSTYLRYSFLVNDRSKFISFHQTRFDLGIWFNSIMQGRSSNFEQIGYELNSCPIAEMCAEHIVNYPTHLKVNNKQITRFAKKYFQKYPEEINFKIDKDSNGH